MSTQKKLYIPSSILPDIESRDALARLLKDAGHPTPAVSSPLENLFIDANEYTTPGGTVLSNSCDGIFITTPKDALTDVDPDYPLLLALLSSAYKTLVSWDKKLPKTYVPTGTITPSENPFA